MPGNRWQIQLASTFVPVLKTWALGGQPRAGKALDLPPCPLGDLPPRPMGVTAQQGSPLRVGGGCYLQQQGTPRWQIAPPLSQVVHHLLRIRCTHKSQTPLIRNSFTSGRLAKSTGEIGPLSADSITLWAEASFRRSTKMSLPIFHAQEEGREHRSFNSFFPGCHTEIMRLLSLLCSRQEMATQEKERWSSNWSYKTTAENDIANSLSNVFL